MNALAAPRILALACTFSLLTGAIAQEAACPAIPPKFPLPKPTHANLSYETDAHGGQTTLDIYLPDLSPGSPKPPMIMLVHGGGWINFASPANWPEYAAYFTHYGYAAAVLQYRLAKSDDPSTQFPAAR
jgi:acetyl esterase/lipase